MSAPPGNNQNPMLNQLLQHLTMTQGGMVPGNMTPQQLTLLRMALGQMANPNSAAPFSNFMNIIGQPNMLVEFFSLFLLNSIQFF